MGAGHGHTDHRADAQIVDLAVARFPMPVVMDDHGAPLPRHRSGQAQRQRAA